MKKIKFGKNKDYVSQLCLGSMLMGTVIDKDTSFEILDNFINSGGNFIDTANCYAWWIGKGEYIGNESEQLLGEWMKRRRNRNNIFLATKSGARLKHPDKIRGTDGIPKWENVVADYEGSSKQTVRNAVEASLQRLQTDYIDLYYVHIDDRSIKLEETLEVLNELVKEGKIRNIGCSNYRTWRLAEARKISDINNWVSYTAIQQQYSYFQPKFGADFGASVNANQELFNYCESNKDVTILAYSPLLKGIYDDEKKRNNYYNWSLFDTDDNKKRLETLTHLAQSIGITNNNLVLAWMLHHQPLVIPILGFSSKGQYIENIKSLSIQLTSEQMNILNKAV